MGALAWTMMGLALWHFTVFLPDRCWSGIIGAFLVAGAGGLAGGYLLPSPGLPMDDPPGVDETIFAAIGTTVALALSYFYGSRAARDED